MLSFPLAALLSVPSQPNMAKAIAGITAKVIPTPK
jgi:hypothetical protein